MPIEKWQASHIIQEEKIVIDTSLRVGQYTLKTGAVLERVVNRSNKVNYRLVSMKLDQADLEIYMNQIRHRRRNKKTEGTFLYFGI